MGTCSFAIAKGRDVAGQKGAKKKASSAIIVGFRIKIEALTVVACPGHSGTEHCSHRDYIG